MRRPVRILIAGAIVAAPWLPPLAAVATSQSTVVNGQVQLGEGFSTQTLNVVSASGVAGTTTAQGNGLYGAVQSGDLNIQSSQIAGGNVYGTTVTNVADYVGGPSVVVTSGTGNNAGISNLGGGALRGT